MEPIGFSGDNGPATSAQLNQLTGIAVDSAGNLYIADTGNYRIRKISNGVITTVAGSGGSTGLGDNGPATGVRLGGPIGLTVDPLGNLFISDSQSHRISKVSNGVITVVAGNGTQGFSGDNGPATSAQLSGPSGIMVDPFGNLFIADSGNNRIRVLTPGSVNSPSITAVTNAASNLPGPIAPGEIVVLYGSGLGPGQLTQFHVDSAGNVDTQLAGTSVSLNGTPAPIIYTSATQVAAIVPYGVSGTNAQVTVTYQGQTSPPATVTVAASNPGLFTSDSTGKGQAAAINQDGSYNGTGHPAPVGSIISLYATGEGQTSPGGVDGKPAQAPLPSPVLPVTVTIGGLTLKPQYAGGAPGEVAGVMQINVQVPSGIAPGNAVPVTIQVGSATSQAGVTIAVAGN